MNQPLPVEYTPMASGGVARATEAGRSSAKKHGDKFCFSKRIALDSNGIANIERLSEVELCDEKFFLEFSTYLTSGSTIVRSTYNVF